MENTKNQRVIDVINYLKEKRTVRNQQDFVERIGSNKSTVSGIVTGKREATQNVLKAIADSFPEISLEWLLTGEGDMLKAANIAIDHSVAGNNNNVTLQTPGLIGKALDEIAAQRKLVERLVAMLEKVVEQLTSREEYNS